MASVTPCKYGHALGRLSNGTCRECDRLRSRGWRLNNKPHMREYITGYRMTNRSDLLIFEAGRRAKTKGLAFDLDLHKDHYRAILDIGLCQITGLPFSFNLEKRRGPFTPSLDRIKPELGYTHGNVRFIVWGLNTAMVDWGEDAFAVIARAFLQSRK